MGRATATRRFSTCRVPRAPAWAGLGGTDSAGYSGVPRAWRYRRALSVCGRGILHTAGVLDFAVGTCAGGRNSGATPPHRPSVCSAALTFSHVVLLGQILDFGRRPLGDFQAAARWCAGLRWRPVDHARQGGCDPARRRVFWPPCLWLALVTAVG